VGAELVNRDRRTDRYEEALRKYANVPQRNNLTTSMPGTMTSIN